jgi:hypothetical protein
VARSHLEFFLSGVFRHFASSVYVIESLLGKALCPNPYLIPRLLNCADSVIEAQTCAIDRCATVELPIDACLGEANRDTRYGEQYKSPKKAALAVFSAVLCISPSQPLPMPTLAYIMRQPADRHHHHDPKRQGD